MLPKIKRLVKGKAPTLLEQAKGNEIIDRVNLLSNIRIGRGNSDYVYQSREGVVLQVKPSGKPTDCWVCINGEPQLKKILLEE